MTASIEYKFLAISGSLRAGSFSIALARGLIDLLPKGATLAVFTLENIPSYNADEDRDSALSEPLKFREEIASSDGVILVSPEYNYGMPGLLKNALDWASRPAFESVLKNKPALIITSSPGPTGGVRAHGQLRETLSGTLSKVVSRRQIAISRINKKLDGNKVLDPETANTLIEGLEHLVHEVNVWRTVSS